MSWLDEYYFAHPGMFVIPVEHLSRAGLSAEFREQLHERTPYGEAWSTLFEASFRTYWERMEELSRQAPAHWFPPRVLHACIVTEPALVRPFFQPFHRSAWLLYASDFEPTSSNVEFGAFQIIQAERAGLMQQVVPALPCNLSYWLVRSDEEVALFCDACNRTKRPDGAAWRALAAALPWVRELRHEVLRRPVLESAETIVTVPGTGLLIPRSRQPEIDELVRTWTRVIEQAAEGHYATHAPRERNHAEDVCDWLRAKAPRVIVTGPEGRLVWDPERPAEMAAVRAQLKGITKTAAESLQADLATVGDRSQAFVDSLSQAAQLPAPDPRSADQNGLSYMHIERKEVAYNIREPGMRRLAEPAPPYERFMLAARTVHEWGHLATSAGWVPVPEARRAQHEGLLAEAATLFEEVVAEAPAEVRTLCSPALAKLAENGESTGEALVRFALSRVEDYQSNLLSQRYLEPAERETYIRNNVRSLVHDYSPEGFFHRLARYVYEYQYLRFSGIGDTRTFFLRGTWFDEQYLRQRILSEEQFDRLLDRMARICDGYAVDESRFSGGVHAS